MSKYLPLCNCSSYRFPHRVGGGKCECSIRKCHYRNGLFLDQVDDLCEDCGQPAETVTEDFGIGAYEYWGCAGFDTNIQTVTECCGAALVPNEDWRPPRHCAKAICTARTAIT